MDGLYAPPATPSVQEMATAGTGVVELYAPPPAPSVEEDAAAEVKVGEAQVDEVLPAAVEDSGAKKEGMVAAQVSKVEEDTGGLSGSVAATREESRERGSSSGKKSLGEALVDAIVEGVPKHEVEEDEPVDKSQIVYLVDTGKIKKLTVSKLKRLLSAHNLKISGKKSELIARLTSFAKSM